MQKVHSPLPSSNIMKQKPLITPQTNIYNRHFYLRGAEHEMRQIRYEQEIKQLSNKPKITPASYLILVEQLEKKMTKVFAEVCGKNERSYNMNNQFVDFQQLQKIVLKLTQIQDSNAEFQVQHFLSQIWMILGEYKLESQIRANLVFSTFRVLLDPYNLDVKQSSQMLKSLPQFQNSKQNRQTFLEQYPQLEDETLNEIQILKLWRKIRYSHPSFTNLISKISEGQRPSYRPEINKRSEELAQKSMRKYIQNNYSHISRTLKDRHTNETQSNQLSRYLEDQISGIQNQKPSHHDILYKRKLAKDYIVPKYAEKEQNFQSRISRTAKPEEVREIVNNLYVIKQKKEDTDFSKIDEENQLKKCTFSPKINKNYSSRRNSISPAVKGYEKQVSRLNKGREQKQKKRQAYQNLGRVKNSSRNHSKSPSQSHFSFIERDTPKLILQINIDGDRVEQLKLRGDENPHLVSKKFVIKHGLQLQMIQVLQSLVKEQLNNL